VKKLLPHAVGISILPPSIEELRKRLTARGKDSPETIERRMAVARDEIKHALDFEYIIVNESFDVAVTDLQSIVRAARLSRPQQEARLASLLAQFR
jgi:guanylate kinase